MDHWNHHGQGIWGTTVAGATLEASVTGDSGIRFKAVRTGMQMNGDFVADALVGLIASSGVFPGFVPAVLDFRNLKGLPEGGYEVAVRLVGNAPDNLKAAWAVGLRVVELGLPPHRRLDEWERVLGELKSAGRDEDIRELARMIEEACREFMDTSEGPHPFAIELEAEREMIRRIFGF